MANHLNFIDYFKQAEKPSTEFKVGLEYELIGFEAQSQQRLSYSKIKQFLHWCVQEHGWQPIYEQDYLIGAEQNAEHISLEPGGQLEISTKPSFDLTEQQQRIQAFLSQLSFFAKKEHWRFYQMGYDPFSSLAEIPWMPKKRYQIMREYLHPLGDQVWHMMQGSCSFHVSLDFGSEKDMRDKFKLSSQIAPIVNTLFAASPLLEKRLTALQSFRNQVWNFIDPQRTKTVSTALADNFGYSSYVDYILNVPMFLIERDQQIIDMRGQSFIKFIEQGFNGYQFEPTDFNTQLGVAFPPVRLRNTLEIRGADASNLNMCLSLAAFWKGLLYDPESLQQGLNLVKNIDLPQLEQWFLETPKMGLQTKVAGLSCIDLAEQLLILAKAGLQRLSPKETHFLTPLEQIVNQQQPLAVQWANALKTQSLDAVLSAIAWP